MPGLFKCENCETKSWNLIPYDEYSYTLSPHVHSNGVCPVCGNKFEYGFNTSSVNKPQWKSTFFGKGLINNFVTVQSEEKARVDHYFFPHKTLCMYLHHGNRKLIEDLFEKKEAINSVIKRATKLLELQMNQQNVEFTIDLSEISVDRFTIIKKSPMDDRKESVELPFLLFTLNQPKGIPESYYIGVCLTKPVHELSMEEEYKDFLVYCTLEVCGEETSKTRTVLGRWYFDQKEDKFKHVTYIGGPYPQDPYQFIEYVERLVSIIGEWKK